jgi:protoporphyrinogen oxidase
VEDQRISGYVNESMKGDDTTQGDTTLLCAWLHEDYAKSLLAQSDEEIFTAVAKALNDVCPWIESEDQLTPHDLHRWDYAMPKFYAGHLKNVADFLQNGQGQQNIYFTGDYLNSPWTEGALRCGQRVAQQIISDVQ